MYELLYTSVSPQGLSEPELMDILKRARTKNRSLDITGMLLYHDREIMQILEGEETDVKTLFHTISNDSRHRSVEVIYQGEINQRSFSQWTMAFELLDQNNARELVAGFEEFDCEQTPISMIKDSPNRGKKSFLWLRDRL